MNFDTITTARSIQDAKEAQLALTKAIEKNTATLNTLIERVAALEAKIDTKKNKKSDSAEV